MSVPYPFWNDPLYWQKRLAWHEANPGKENDYAAQGRDRPGACLTTYRNPNDAPGPTTAHKPNYQCAADGWHLVADCPAMQEFLI